MPIDTQEERMAAMNSLMTPWIIFPKPTFTIADEDRAMLNKVYLPLTFPPPPMELSLGAPHVIVGVTI